MISAPDAIPACSVIQPTLCPMTSTINTRCVMPPWYECSRCSSSQYPPHSGNRRSYPFPRYRCRWSSEADHIEALLGQAVCSLLGTVSAEHDQTVKLQLLVGLLHGLTLSSPSVRGIIHHLKRLFWSFPGSCRPLSGFRKNPLRLQLLIISVDQSLVAL